MKLQEAG